MGEVPKLSIQLDEDNGFEFESRPTKNPFNFSTNKTLKNLNKTYLKTVAYRRVKVDQLRAFHSIRTSTLRVEALIGAAIFGRKKKVGIKRRVRHCYRQSLHGAQTQAQIIHNDFYDVNR